MDVIFFTVQWIAIIINVIVTLYIWRNRHVPGGTAFASFMTLLTLGSFQVMLQQFSLALEGIQLFFYAVIPVPWLIFNLQYAALQRWITRGRIAGLCVIPAISTILIFTNPLHGLFFKQIHYSFFGFLRIATSVEYGPWFWIHAAYSYLLILIGMGILVRTALRSIHIYRGQAIALLSAAVIPLIPNMLYTFKLIAFQATFIGFTFTCVIIAVLMHRFRFLDLNPIARGLLIDNMNGAMLVLDQADRIVDMNPAMAAFLGRPMKEVIGSPGGIALERCPALLAHLRDAHEAQSEIALPLGTKVGHYDLRITPLFDKRRRLIGRMLVLDDVSARKEAEQALRRSDEFSMRLIAAIPDIVIHTNTQGEILFINDRGLEVSGSTREDIIGKNMLSFIAPEDLEAAIQNTFLMMEQPLGPKEYNLFIRETEKSLYEVNGSVLKKEDGAPYGMVYVIRDISERKRAEEALKEAEEKYRTILDSMDSGYYEVDVRGNMVFHNPALRNFLGFDEKELQGLNFSEFMDKEQAQQAFRIFKEVFESGNPSGDFYGRFSRKDRKSAYAAASVYPIKDSQGAIVGFRGTVRDITALKEAKDAADAANRSKSVFLANMSHEIRTPLNAILGFSQLMRRDPSLTPQSREHLDIINRSGEHLLATINDLLEMSKIEAGRSVLVPTTFDLHALLYDLERMFRLRTDSKNLRFLVERVGQVPRWVITDEGKLRQVLINLLGNAVKFTEEGGISLRASGKVENADTVNLQFEIEDTGPGVAEDEIDHLFQVFEQTRTGVKSGGTGLGLALSRGFAALMGGTLSVTSEVGKGSIFRFNIPIQEGMEEHAAKQEVKQRVLFMRPGQDEIRVLIADDRETNRQLLSQMLAAVGFATRGAVNGAEAVQMVLEWKPQLVLMDMAMPVMDGYEAICKIKESPVTRDTAIVAVTASAFEEDKKRILDAGADDYLSKPFKETELFKIIGRLTGAEYLYEEIGGGEKTSQPADDAALMRKAVASLPAELVNRILSAVESADLDLLNELALQLVTDYPTIAQQIQEMASRYEYDRLIDLFSEHEGGQHG